MLLHALFPQCNHFLVITVNHEHACAYWEAGYQLLNLLVQGHVLDISYQAAILNVTNKRLLQESGLAEPVGLFAF